MKVKISPEMVKALKDFIISYIKSQNIMRVCIPEDNALFYAAGYMDVMLDENSEVCMSHYERDDYKFDKDTERDFYMLRDIVNIIFSNY